MIEDLQNAVQSFIPFTSRVYFRLIEQHNETTWPWQIVALFAGMVAVALAAKRLRSMSFLPLGIAWIWVGLSFFQGRYAELVWAGDIFGWLFAAQGLALLMCGFFSFWNIGNFTPPAKLRVVGGCVTAAAGLILYPLLTASRAEGWNLAEVFGIFPAPTALVTLGVLIATLRGIPQWFLLVMPAVWLLLEAATHWGFGG